MQEGLGRVEEPGEHLATGEGREEVVFVAVDDGCLLVPKVVTVEQDMVDGVTIFAVRTGDVVIGVLPEAGRVCGIEGVSCDKLKCGGLVGL